MATAENGPPTNHKNSATSAVSNQEKDRQPTTSMNTFSSAAAASVSTSSHIATNKPFSKLSAAPAVPETVEEPYCRPETNNRPTKNSSNRAVRFEPTNQLEPENVPQNIIEASKENNKTTNIITSNASFLPPSYGNDSPVKTSAQNYSFLSNGKANAVTASTSSIQTMNEKLQSYLQLKQRNLGTSQRRSSVLQPNSNLLNPGRSSLLPSNGVLDTSVSVIGKRDLAQIAQERSFVAESAVVKKTRTDSNYAVNLTSLNTNHGSKRYTWR